MAGTSSLVAGLLLYASSMLSGASAPKWNQWKNALVTAVAMLAFGNGCVVWAEQKVPSAITALILATEPAWLALLDWAFFRKTKPAPGVFAGIFIGFVGVGLLVGNGLSSVQAFPIFDASLILAAAVAWSWGSLYCRQADLPNSSFLSIAMPLILGGAILLLIGLGAGEWRSLELSRVPAEAMAAFFYITFVSNAMTYAAYLWLLKNVSITRVSTYAYVNPLVALVLGAWVAHERVTALTLAGAAAIGMSVAFILKFSTSYTTEAA